MLTRLIGEHLLMADDKGGWTAYQPVGGAPLDYVQESEGRARPHPPVLLFCGIFDWLCFYEEIGGRDVALPADVLAADMYAADEAGMLDFDAAATIAGRYLEPLERGLRLLRSYGLRNLCLHSVQPPLPDDELFAPLLFPVHAVVALPVHDADEPPAARGVRAHRRCRSSTCGRW